MGSKLAVLAWQLILAGVLARSAAAQSAGDLAKQGIELYKAGKYAEAITALEKSYNLEPKPETLFALAQAERLAGQCDKAVPHYRKLIETIGDLGTARLIASNLALCLPKEEPKAEPKAEPKPEPATPPPPKTIVREVSRTNGFGTAMLGVGMLALGGGVGMFLSSSASFDAAADARTLEAHDALEDRGKRDRAIAFVSGGIGAALIGIGIYKLTAGRPSSVEVSVTPGSDRATLVVSGRW